MCYTSINNNKQSLLVLLVDIIRTLELQTWTSCGKVFVNNMFLKNMYAGNNSSRLPWFVKSSQNNNIVYSIFPFAKLGTLICNLTIIKPWQHRGRWVHSSCCYPFRFFKLQDEQLCITMHNFKKIDISMVIYFSIGTNNLCRCNNVITSVIKKKLSQSLKRKT